MVKKSNDESLDLISQKEISIVEANDKLAKLEKDRARDKKIIAEYKEREKATARALILYERKMRFLRENTVKQITELTEKIATQKNAFNDECQKIASEYIRDQITPYKDNYSLFENTLYDICTSVEKNSILTNDERAFIANKKVEKEPVDLQSRFDRLKQQFNQKIGDSVNRKPGRPRKSEQSIIADIGLRHKVERQVDDKDATENRINEIFYNAPIKNPVYSSIPNTDDSTFDFNEALNPDLSLKDIMADLMTERKEEETDEIAEKTEEIKQAKKQSDIELLESGFIRNTKLGGKLKENKTIDPMQKKPTFEKRFLSIQSIIKNSK